MAQLIHDPRATKLSDLLKRDSHQYKVPMYQRDYQWSEDQIEDFEEDMFQLVRDDSEHFFGSIVLTINSPEDPDNNDSDISYVIDGQQRLTTSLISFAVLRHLFFEFSAFPTCNETAIASATELNDLLFLGDRDKLESQRPRLSANRSNQKFLTSILTTKTSRFADVKECFSELTDEDQLRSSLMFAAYLQLRKRFLARAANAVNIDADIGDDTTVEEIIPDSEAKEAQEHLYQIGKAMRSRAIFVVLNIRSWTDAFAVFEGLNNRGLDLSEKDLVKNSILARGHKGGAGDPEVFSQLEKTWATIEARIADGKFANFLRHFLLLYRDEVSIKRVLRDLRDQFHDYDAEALLTLLDKATKSYEPLLKPSVLGTKADTKIRQQLTALKTYDTSRSYPIALAARLAGLNRTEQLRIFRAIEVLNVRRSVILHLDNKSIEESIGKIARDLFVSGSKGLDAALEAIRSITPGDRDFKREFEVRVVAKSAVARMLLVQLENHLRGHEHELDFDKTTLEHICPQEPKEWNLSAVQLHQHPTILNRLGNLSLLTDKANAKLSNRPFVEKTVFYKTEGLRINSGVVEKSDWFEDEIGARQKTQAEIACDVWPLEV